MIFSAVLSATSPAAPSTAAGPKAAPDPTADVNVDLSRYEIDGVVAELVGATGGTLDVYLQFSPDAGVTWVDWLHFAQLAAGAAAVKTAVAMHKPTAYSATTVGEGTAPALPAAALVPVHPGDRLRLLFVAGAGTTLGGVQTVRIFGRDRSPR